MYNIFWARSEIIFKLQNTKKLNRQAEAHYACQRFGNMGMGMEMALGMGMGIGVGNGTWRLWRLPPLQSRTIDLLGKEVASRK